MLRLGVNIDHVATVREIRKGIEPEPVNAAFLAESAGADSIVVHLREDRRHIREQDLFVLRKTIKTKMNLEMSIAAEIVRIACRVKPDQATLVPERRQELTTEGGLNVDSNLKKIKRVKDKLEKNGIAVSVFIDPEKKQIDAAVKAGIRLIELHTGRLAEAKNKRGVQKSLRELKTAAKYAKAKGMRVFAGHGLDYYNVCLITGIREIEELNIGYSIVCRAVLMGMEEAVREMKALIRQ